MGISSHRGSGTEAEVLRPVLHGGATQSRKWPKLYNAPVLIAVCSSKKQYLDRYAEPDKGWTDRDESRWPAPFWHIDAGFAALLTLLTAVDQGLGSVFTGIRRPERFKTAFEIPEEYTPIGMIFLGYPAPDRPSPSLKRGRKPVEEVVHLNQWRNKYSLNTDLDEK